MGTKVAIQEELNSKTDNLEAKRKEGIKWLNENFGKHKSGISLSKEELNKIALNHTEKRAKRIARKFGFI